MPPQSKRINVGLWNIAILKASMPPHAVGVNVGLWNTVILQARMRMPPRVSPPRTRQPQDYIRNMAYMHVGIYVHVFCHLCVSC